MPSDAAAWCEVWELVWAGDRMEQLGAGHERLTARRGCIRGSIGYLQNTRLDRDCREI